MARLNFFTTSLLAISSLSSFAAADDILSSSGFSNCLGDASIRVNHANIQFNKDTGMVTFDASGTSTKEQNVTAKLVVTAYGQTVYQNAFDPCADATKVTQLCPVPAGNFSASGTQTIPSEYLSKIPSIAFSVPDIDADAELHLTAKDGSEVACVKSGVTNGKSLNSPALQGVGAGILVGSLVLAGIGAAANAGAAGSATMSPSFTTMLGWFQGMAMNGMLSVNYPSSYRNFANTFGFSAGVIPWNSMQITIDNFRNATGGNLTADNVQYLHNATLVYTDGQHNTTNFKRALVNVGDLMLRDLSTSVNSTSDDAQSTGFQKTVHGVEAYVEMLSVPQANTFMTVLLIFAIILGAIIVGILGFKLILELWATFASFPKRLTGFRKRYWRLLANTITNLILVLYGIWTIWCIFQFTNGDSWAAKTLAGVTWGLFTAVLVFYTVMMFMVVRKHKQMDQGSTDGLYEDKDTWHKYSFLYDSYKRGYWWLFVPFIVYMFAKGVVIAAGDGHGLGQTAAQLIIESLMFILLLWTRPFATKGSNWINIAVQVVRVLSVVCILTFVEELGIQQTTKTITGVVLIAVQCTLTGILGILLVINAIRLMFRENIHKKQRKELKNKELEAGGAFADDDPADIPLAHQPTAYGGQESKTPLMREVSPVDPNRSSGMSRPTLGRNDSGAPLTSDAASFGRTSSQERIVSRGPGPIGGADDGMGEWPLSPMNRPMSRQPTLPSVDPGVATVGNGRPAYRPQRQPTLPRMD